LAAHFEGVFGGRAEIDDGHGPKNDGLAMIRSSSIDILLRRGGIGGGRASGSPPVGQRILDHDVEIEEPRLGLRLELRGV
jgi:hypothetical protein